MLTRNIELIGEDAQNKLINSKVCVVGIGGVGGYAVEMLARSGIGNIMLIDFDIIEKSNINRQIIATHSNIGMFKTDCMQQRIKEINPNCNVVCLRERINNQNIAQIIENFTYVIDAIDSVTDKICLIKYCKENNIPIISSMGTGNRIAIPNYIVQDLFKTSGDGLAKVLRRELKDKIKNLDVVISATPTENKQKNIASICYHPAICGCILASFVIKSIIDKGE